MKPLFTVHAGELLVGTAIRRKFPRVNIWVPAKDTGIDLLLSNSANRKAISLQVKFSRDYLVTHVKHELLNKELTACGWWTPTRKEIAKSRADYWVFVLIGFANRSADYIIINPKTLLRRLDAIHGKATSKFQVYLWVTRKNMCWETRGLKRLEHVKIADKTFRSGVRNFSRYLNNWGRIKALNG